MLLRTLIKNIKAQQLLLLKKLGFVKSTWLNLSFNVK